MEVCLIDHRMPNNAANSRGRTAVDVDKLVDCKDNACKPRGPRGGPGAKFGHWTPLLNERGVCYTLRLNRPMDLESLFLGFNHNALLGLPDEAPEVHVFFHGEKAPVVESGRWMQRGLVLPHPYITMRLGEMVEVEVSAELGTLPSLRRRPCHSERRYSRAFCRQQCARRLQTEHTGCRAPWVPGPAERDCSTLQQVLASVAPNDVTAARVRHGCLCHIGCTREQWTITELERHEFDFALQYNISRLRLRWAEEVGVTTEELTCGFSSLFSDIGGIIGILLLLLFLLPGGAPSRPAVGDRRPTAARQPVAPDGACSRGPRPRRRRRPAAASLWRIWSRVS